MLLNSNRNFFFIPDFVEIQRKSFLDFLEKGLISEIKKRNFISTANNDVQLIFYPEYYKLNPPECTPKQAILKSKSYTCRLYIPAQLINNLTKEINLQWVLLGNLPLMTKRGHFIINGSPRVIINQMIRSPGIYYQEMIDKNKKRSYYADLISNRGTWLRLEIDKKQRVWARMKKTPKISIFIFLQSMGLTKQIIYQSIHYSYFLDNSEDIIPSSTEQALIDFYSKTHPKKDETEITSDMGHKFLFRKFMNSRTYDLGKLGRIQLNKKLGLSIPLTTSTLTPQDILFAVNYLINLEHGLGSIDDIDHLKNRRVRASGELIQNQLGTGLIRLEKMIREKLKKPKKNLTIRSLITTKPINGALREFFGSSPLSQFMDQTNPLAEITHKRRVSSLGPGGVSRETAGMAVRGIHPSHYGRICPIETPEGPNAGLVNSITTYTKINSEGFLETPFYEVSKGQIQKKKGPVFFSAEHEENLNVAPGDLKTNIFNFLPKNLIPIRNSQEFQIISRNKVDYIAISPIQMISIATSLIPFLEHDDANRALMGSNMQRQAVPLIAPERPVIGTGLEARVVSDSGHILQAKTSGFVSYVSGDKIIIHTFFPHRTLFESSNSIKFYGSNINVFNNFYDTKLLNSGILVPQKDYPIRSIKADREFYSSHNYSTRVRPLKIGNSYSYYKNSLGQFLNNQEDSRMIISSPLKQEICSSQNNHFSLKQTMDYSELKIEKNFYNSNFIVPFKLEKLYSSCSNYPIKKLSYLDTLFTNIPLLDQEKYYKIQVFFWRQIFSPSVKALPFPRLVTRLESKKLVSQKKKINSSQIFYYLNLSKNKKLIKNISLLNSSLLSKDSLELKFGKFYNSSCTIRDSKRTLFESLELKFEKFYNSSCTIGDGKRTLFESSESQIQKNFSISKIFMYKDFPNPNRNILHEDSNSFVPLPSYLVLKENKGRVFLPSPMVQEKYLGYPRKKFYKKFFLIFDSSKVSALSSFQVEHNLEKNKNLFYDSRIFFSILEKSKRFRGNNSQRKLLQFLIFQQLNFSTISDIKMNMNEFQIFMTRMEFSTIKDGTKRNFNSEDSTISDGDRVLYHQRWYQEELTLPSQMVTEFSTIKDGTKRKIFPNFNSEDSNSFVPQNKGRVLLPSPMVQEELTLPSPMVTKFSTIKDGTKRKIFPNFNSEESLDNEIELRNISNLGWNQNDFQQLYLLNKKSIFNNNLLNSWIQNKKIFCFLMDSPDLNGYKIIFAEKCYQENNSERCIQKNDNRILMPSGNTELFSSSTIGDGTIGYGKRTLFKSSQKIYYKDLPIIFHEQRKKLDLKDFIISESTNSLLWNNHYFSKKLNIKNKRGFFIFNFNSKINLDFSSGKLVGIQKVTMRNVRELCSNQNNIVQLIHTSELVLFLKAQANNVFDFSNNSISCKITQSNFFTSKKNALAIHLFQSLKDNQKIQILGTKSIFEVQKNTCLKKIKNKKTKIIINHTNLEREFTISKKTIPLPSPMVPSEMVGFCFYNFYSFILHFYNCKRKVCKSKSKRSKNTIFDGTIGDGRELYLCSLLEQGTKGEVRKNSSLSNRSILNSQKIYFQSILKNFLFYFFQKKLTSFYLRPWNSFFYLFFSQNKTLFFYPISQYLKYYSFDSNSFVPLPSYLVLKENKGKVVYSQRWYFDFCKNKSLPSPMVPSEMVEECNSFIFKDDREIISSQVNNFFIHFKNRKNFLDSKNSKLLMLHQNSLIKEKHLRVHGVVLHKNLIGMKSNSKIRNIRSKCILKSISHKKLPLIPVIHQKKSKKYDAFLNKKSIFKTLPYCSEQDSNEIWIDESSLSQNTIYNSKVKKRTEFQYSPTLNLFKVREINLSQKGLFSSLVTKEMKMFPFVPSEMVRELCSSQSLRNLKNHRNATRTKNFLDLSDNYFTSKNHRKIKAEFYPNSFKYNSIVYNLQNYQRSNQETCLSQNPVVYEGEWIQKGDLLADGTASVKGELALGKNILIGYMPWEGYNFEDAILINERLIYHDIYTSIHIERYEVEICDTKFGVEQITNQIPEIDISEISHLDNNGISKIGSWVKEGNILVGKSTPIQKKLLSPHEKLLYDIVGKDIPTTRDTSLRLPKGVEGRVIDIQVLENENIPPEIAFEGPGRVYIYIAEKRKIQIGDKMAGRHGNKGIVSKILPRQDMPYLPDGTPIDMVLNPLGVPSRMNVGQVFECLLGLAGKYLGQQFKIGPFDEIYGPEASRSLVYSKLFEASLKNNQEWLFNPNFPAKTKLFDGRTGECFDQAVTIGQAYMLKLVHLVDEKIHARSTGPYSLVTQQPLRGRSKHGGQRLGEMEVWAIEGFGAAYTLQELLTVKSDDMKGRNQVMDAILNNKTISLGTPESFKVLIRELQSLCLDVGVYSIESTGHRKQIDVMKLS